MKNLMLEGYPLEYFSTKPEFREALLDAIPGLREYISALVSTGSVSWDSYPKPDFRVKLQGYFDNRVPAHLLFRNDRRYRPLAPTP